MIRMFFVGATCEGMQKIDLFVPSRWKAPAFNELESLPQTPADFEMAEIRLFDRIPDNLRFPQILPVLFAALQKKIPT